MEQHAKDTIDGERGAGVGVELSGQHCSFSVSPSEATGKNRQNEGDAFPFSPNRTTRTRSTGRRPTTSRRATPSRLLRLAQLSGRNTRQLMQRAERSEQLPIKWLLLMAARGLVNVADGSARLAARVARCLAASV